MCKNSFYLLVLSIRKHKNFYKFFSGLTTSEQLDLEQKTACYLYDLAGKITNPNNQQL